MAIIKSITDAISGTLADQWKEVITAAPFDEQSAVVPGVIQQANNGRGNNFYYSDGVISNGSKIFVPENTAAFIFSRSGIEEIITTPGGYEYQNGEASIFNGDGLGAIVGQAIDRVGYGGQSSKQKQIAFVNLREIRDLRFGTKGPMIYNDLFYGTDLEIVAFGTFSVKVTDPVKFIENYVPANVNYYSFNDPKTRSQILSEFLQSFTFALNSLSTDYRISQLPSQVNNIAYQILNDSMNAGTWNERFGFEIIQVGIESIDFSPESREIVKQFTTTKMNLKAYDEVSQKTSNVMAQQNISQGIKERGLGDSGGMLFGMNMVQNLGLQGEQKQQSLSFDEQIEALKKLKDLLDSGILTQEEFDSKKKEIMGL
ncbi:membrane protease subunit (stomatin/prohibitin family) [Enterococcus sp. PF1-24]|uniref:SPFH domain-containing protein n=1 Tax=unclassified Enterococcus TaxID=2608891 RepID=UPI002473839B|nr:MULTISPECIES: SPFH domain-containing protein [unclassified Enterococcus]MDH6365145.1 membrane protease subunit (stomatin/prohibitin family) [Enterococcus sp. PFB1-1]MDH6402271.1 membrane protease subunit (stomatin/prohibitin family) [Enterococcus sp. PF1-24]